MDFFYFLFLFYLPIKVWWWTLFLDFWKAYDIIDSISSFKYHILIAYNLHGLEEIIQKFASSHSPPPSRVLSLPLGKGVGRVWQGQIHLVIVLLCKHTTTMDVSSSLFLCHALSPSPQKYPHPQSLPFLFFFPSSSSSSHLHPLTSSSPPMSVFESSFRVNF